jgi:hypothetical protein
VFTVAEQASAQRPMKLTFVGQVTVVTEAAFSIVKLFESLLAV